MVTMEDYGGAGMGGNFYGNYDGPGIGGADRLSLYDSVFKALSATGGKPQAGPGINAAEVEELSGTLASAEIKEKSLHFWKRVPKRAAKTLNQEWVRLDDYGDEGETGFIGGSDAGFSSDPRFSRGSKIIKYLAVKGQVDYPTQLVELIGMGGRGVNAMNTAQTARMRQLLRLAERNMFHANSDVCDLEFDGAFAQIDAVADADNMCRVDLQGKFLDRYVLIHMSQIAANNNCDISDFYLPNEAYLDLQQSLFPQIRTGDNIPDAAVGANFERLLMMTLGGNPDHAQIKRTQMLTNGVKGALPLKVPTRAGRNAPDKPDTVSGTNVSITTTAYQPGLTAGTYYYSVTANGKGGRSMATQISAGVTVSATEGVKLTIVGDDEDILFYEVFRNEVGTSGVSESNRKYMCRVKRTGPTTYFTDDGYFVPNTMHMGVFSFDDDEIYVKQLLPPVKRQLPQDLMANSFGILMFLALIMEVAEHNLHVVNIGKRLQSGIASVGGAVSGAA
jgi:hypothetical protein